jgi:positive regulator of sigma E activity
MPKGKVPSMLSVQNGPITFDLAKQKSKCGRCHESIKGGDRCAAMKTSKAGFSTSRRLCIECAKAVIDSTMNDVAKIREQLGE